MLFPCPPRPDFRRPRPVWVIALTLLGTLGFAPSPARAQPPAAVRVAQLGFVDGGAEMQRGSGAWTAVKEGDPLSIGDRLRTLRGGTVRLDFPWTAIAMGDGSTISVERNRVLTLRLESGRLDIDPEQALLRVVTGEAAISGTGRTLVRREEGVTFVGSYSGGAEVEGKGTAVRLGLNKGTVVRAGAAPEEAALMSAPPRVLAPAADPRYITPGEAVHLSWTGEETSYHLDVLSMDSDIPVISRDVDGTELDLRLNWLGTFRWRVAGRRGPVESQASGEGLICVVEK
jgi:hypothetical protein